MVAFQNNWHAVFNIAKLTAQRTVGVHDTGVLWPLSSPIGIILVSCAHIEFRFSHEEIGCHFVHSLGFTWAWAEMKHGWILLSKRSVRNEMMLLMTWATDEDTKSYFNRADAWELRSCSVRLIKVDNAETFITLSNSCMLCIMKFDFLDISSL